MCPSVSSVNLKEMLSAEPYPKRLGMNNSNIQAHAFQEQICLTMFLFLWNVCLELCDFFLLLCESLGMFLVHKMQPPVFETLAWIPSLISSTCVLRRPHLVEKDGLDPWICFFLQIYGF